MGCYEATAEITNQTWIRNSKLKLYMFMIWFYNKCINRLAFQAHDILHILHNGSTTMLQAEYKRLKASKCKDTIVSNECDTDNDIQKFLDVLKVV